MFCKVCRTILEPVKMREHLILTMDEAVDPLERLECPRCGTEFSISPEPFKVKRMPEFRA